MVWVADRGLSSKANRAYLSQDGEHYILGEKQTWESEGARAALVRPGRYQRVRENLWVKEVVVGSDRFVICHNPEEEVRDQRVRERLLSYLEEAIAGSDELTATRRAELLGQLKTKPGLSRLLRVTKGGLLRVDGAKVARESHLDGKFLLRSSDPNLSAEEIALGYKQLLQVERGWRDMKTSLRLRPVYHRKEERIRAHIVLCWLALLLIRVAESRTQDSWRNLRQELQRMHLVTLATDHGTVAQRTQTRVGQQAILKALQLDEPPRFYDFRPRAA